MPRHASGVLWTATALAIGMATGACADPADSYSETRAYNLAHGRVVFNDSCMYCHRTGRKGAPVAGDAADWNGRVDQPLSTLIRHAIEGHGDMPARGDTDLSDQDIAAAVAYIVERGRQIVAEREHAVDGLIDELPPTAAGPKVATKDAANAPTEQSDPDDAIVHMLLMLYGKDRWK